MSVWILEGGQTSSDGKAKVPRWTKVAHNNESDVPSSRTSYVASKFGNNWIVHGGRSLVTTVTSSFSVTRIVSISQPPSGRDSIP